LEVNARTMSANAHVSACGINYVLVAYLEALGHDVPALSDYTAGVYDIDLLFDLRSIVNNLVHGSLSFRKLIQSYRGRKEWRVYARDDPLPFLKQLLFSTSQLAKPV
jgi:predicted ATP-grasp superfamily ATP-dependent carboligase